MGRRGLALWCAIGVVVLVTMAGCVPPPAAPPPAPVAAVPEAPPAMPPSVPPTTEPTTTAVPPTSAGPTTTTSSTTTSTTTTAKPTTSTSTTSTSTTTTSTSTTTTTVLPPVGESTALRMVSDPGDYIGGGVTRTYLPSDGTFTALLVGNEVQVRFNVPSAPGTYWLLNFQAPRDRSMIVGPYDGADRSGATSPHLDVSGSGRGCNTLTGRFDVRQLEVGSDGAIARFAADFEQHCEGKAPALRGTIRWNAADPYPAVPDADHDDVADTKDNCLTTPNPGQVDADQDGFGNACDPRMDYSWLEMRSEAADYIGRGQTRIRYLSDGTFSAVRGANRTSVTLGFGGGGTDNWSFTFASPDGDVVPGTYEGAVKYLSQPGVPGLQVAGGGRACNKLSGSFTVHDIAFSPLEDITRFSADFEQRCDGSTAVLRGSLRFRVAEAPPAPPAMVHAPVVSSFAPVVAAGPAPHTTALRFSVADVDGDALTCGLDADDNGTYEMAVKPCGTDVLRSATFPYGTNRVGLIVSDGTGTPVTATTSVTATSTAADPYAVTVRYAGTMTSSQRSAFASAATRWAQVIKGGLSDQTFSLAAGECLAGTAAFSGTVDDVLIDAMVTPIDGPGGILGSAGPCLVRNSGDLTVYGVMMFDSADVAELEADGQFGAVVLHEMGHVLGVGTLWSSPLLTGAGGTDPRFVGTVALGAWQALGGVGSVPVENTGGAGTADSHWRESVFGSELMTGWLDGGPTPMSALTVASLADLGYRVDLGRADSFVLPSRSPLAALQAAVSRTAPSVDLDVLPIRPHRSV